MSKLGGTSSSWFKLAPNRIRDFTLSNLPAFAAKRRGVSPVLFLRLRQGCLRGFSAYIKEDIIRETLHINYIFHYLYFSFENLKMKSKTMKSRPVLMICFL